jgi:hypothetical protein
LGRERVDFRAERPSLIPFVFHRLAMSTVRLFRMLRAMPSEVVADVELPLDF